MTAREKIMQESQILFAQKGYDATSVQNIIDAVGIAKGTFYDYFESKEELLEEIITSVTRMQAAYIMKQLEASDEDALSKFSTFMQLQSQWKSTQFDVLYMTLKILYSDQNCLYIKKVKEKNLIYFVPIMNLIIRQGIEENVFDTPYPDSIGEMLIRLSNDFSDTIAKALVNHREYNDLNAFMDERIKLLMHCIERLIGIKNAHLPSMDADMLDEFIAYLRSVDDVE